MEEILRISDEVTIMRDGQWVATRPASELTMNEIIRLMVGRELTNRFPPKDYTVTDECVMKVDGLTALYSDLKDVSFELNKGEILGVAGLDGSGRTELLESIFGIATRKEGTIYKDGVQIGNHSPTEAIANGFAMVTEERRATGIFSILSIRENTVISSLKRYVHHHLYLRDKEMKEKNGLVDKRHAYQNADTDDEDPRIVRRQPTKGYFRTLAFNPIPTFSCWMNQPAASTWARNLKSTS